MTLADAKLRGLRVDREDIQKLLALGTGWYVCSGGGWNGYLVINVQHRKRKHLIPAHRVIMNAKPGELIDHRDGNTLDNRKRNLRRAHKRGNSRNMRNSKNQKNGGYKGVFTVTRSPSWRAQIGFTPDGSTHMKQFYLGTYRTPEDAAYAYNLKAIELFGEFAAPNKLPKNFVPSPRLTRRSSRMTTQYKLLMAKLRKTRRKP